MKIAQIWSNQTTYSNYVTFLMFANMNGNLITSPFPQVSLVKHLTAGTLTSLTNLASSVARNLERLSLDEEHAARSDAGRRAPPLGLTSSFMTGLAAFGISLLGTE